MVNRTAKVALLCMLTLALGLPALEARADSGEIVGVADVTARGPRFFVRLEEDPAEDASVQLGVVDGPPLGEAATLRAVATADMPLTVEWLILDGGSVFPAEEDEFDGARREALVTSIQRTLNLGEEFIIVRVGDSVVVSEPTGDLAMLESSVRTQFGGVEAPADMWTTIQNRISARPLSSNEVMPPIVMIVVSSPIEGEVDLDAVSALARERNISVSALVVQGSQLPPADAASGPLCELAAATGGACRGVSYRPEFFDGAIAELSESAQRIYLAQAGCAAELEPDGSVMIRVGTTRESGVEVPAERVSCLSYRRFDPTWEPSPPEPEGSAEEASATPVPDPVMQSTWIEGVPNTVVVGAAGGVIALLLVAVALVLRGRKKAGVDPLEAFAENTDPVAAKNQGPVEEQPSWLRDPSVERARAMVRSHRSAAQGLHLVWSDEHAVHEMPLQMGSTLLVGNREDCHLKVAAVPRGQVALELIVDTNGLQVMKVDASVTVDLDGRAVESSMMAVDGSELVIGHLVMMELRAHRSNKQNWSISPEDDRTFDAFSPDVTNTVLGRDPLPYRGVRALPCKLSIPMVSGDHAEFWVSGGRLFVRDLGSSNGTKVDEELVTPFVPREVRPEQVISLSALVKLLAR